MDRAHGVVDILYQFPPSFQYIIHVGRHYAIIFYYVVLIYRKCVHAHYCFTTCELVSAQCRPPMRSRSRSIDTTDRFAGRCVCGQIVYRVCVSSLDGPFRPFGTNGIVHSNLKMVCLCCGCQFVAHVGINGPWLANGSVMMVYTRAQSNHHGRFDQMVCIRRFSICSVFHDQVGCKVQMLSNLLQNLRPTRSTNWRTWDGFQRFQR